jgi:hypothetical protein
MDSSFIVKPVLPVAASRALRDPVAVRQAADVPLTGDKAVTALQGEKDQDQDSRGDGGHGRAPERKPEHVPQDLVTDTDSRDVIYRERDVRALEREHPDQALLRQRAYHSLPPADAPAEAPGNPHADIKA